MLSISELIKKNQSIILEWIIELAIKTSLISFFYLVMTALFQLI